MTHALVLTAADTAIRLAKVCPALCPPQQVTAATVESWLPIEGFPEYAVSTEGRVYSHLSHRVLRQGRAHNTDLAGGQSYRSVVLRRNGRSFTKSVHRLVGLAFLPNPTGEHLQIRHLNGDPSDNRMVNLAWGTASQNAMDRRAHGNETAAKITPEIAAEIRQLCKLGADRQLLSQRYGVTTKHISRILRGDRWRIA
ncbi:MAG TPA: HNH endonuclease [Novosphingobium sp.]|nr:HNH endonuclease [Novosphingobium sp.]HZV09243.1 HNH endonuclease [Novosphingobium sp.]